MARRGAEHQLDDILATCRVSYRKLRLFCVACCLESHHARPGEASCLAGYLETLEWADAPKGPPPKMWATGWWLSNPRGWARQWCKDQFSGADKKRAPGGPSVAYILADVLKGVRAPMSVPRAARSWDGGAAFALAKAAYQDIDETGRLKGPRLLVLSDALEAAGVTDAELLAHLRSTGPHYRGCHVLDAVLGKA
jgi:hypothetical protein